MEVKRDEEEMKHVCKLCNKRYPSGKSLGGHMRSHVIANSHKNKPIIIPKKVIHFDDDDDDDEDDDGDDDDDGYDDDEDQREGKQSGYGLRENPKKTWRLVDSRLNNNNHNTAKQQVVQFEQQERVCKQCGKGFHSLKALCGHMSSHSDHHHLNHHHKDVNFNDGDEDEDEDDDVSWSSGSKDQLIPAIESHSDNNNNNMNNSSNLKRQTRASMSRYKSLTAVDSLSPTANGGGSSSNHSEIDQHEQEEVAMCLMMLSRDSSSAHTKPTCFNLTTAESSDNNSVILEGGSSNNYVGVNVVAAKNNNKDLCFIKNHDKKKIIVEEEVNVKQEMDNSDSGYFENGAKELESDDSVDGFARNFGIKKPKFEFRSFNNIYQDGDYSRKRRIREAGHISFDSPESDENSSKKIIKQDYNNNGYYPNNPSIKKGSKYECCVCKKIFKTHQALGGHIISHKKNGENSLSETKISAKKLAAAKVVPSKAKKAKGHKCPYCPKVFKSGQALGGHKRSHMIGSSSNRILNLDNDKSKAERNPPTRLEPVQLQQPPLIDLNLPAPMEEEGSGNSQFVAW